VTSVTVRDLTAGDLPAARALLRQLGYDIDADDLIARFLAVSQAGAEHALMVAELDGAVVGLLHIFARPAVEKPTEALVQSLVVDETRRGAGIGKALMARAEAWARDQGFASVALHTQVKRTDARAFYRAIGYDEVTEAVLMRKKLEDQ